LTVEKIDNIYINLVSYRPLKGSSYIQLQNSAKGLISLKIKNNECFRWCHIRHLNPKKTNPQRIKRKDKALVDTLHYRGIAFPIDGKQYNKIEKLSNIGINAFGYENKQPFPFI